MSDIGLLSALIWLPIIGGLVVLALGDARLALARWVALGTAVAAFALSVSLWTGFDAGTAAFQSVERLQWIPAFNATYHLGIDGISLPLVLLTTFITVPVLIAAWTVIEKRQAQFFAAFLILEGLMVGVFTALDALHRQVGDGLGQSPEGVGVGDLLGAELSFLSQRR